MKSIHSVFTALAFFAGCFLPTSRATLAAGDRAPTFAIKDIRGATQQLADYKGRIVVLEWVNSGCPFVQKHYESGNIPKLQKSAVADGVVWLTINSGHPGAQGDLDDASAAAWLRSHGAEPTAYVRDRDGKIGRLYGAKTTPHLFVINREGTVVYQGAIDSIRSANPADLSRATNYVAAALEDLKAGRALRTFASQPYGCAVKY